MDEFYFCPFPPTTSKSDLEWRSDQIKLQFKYPVAPDYI